MATGKKKNENKADDALKKGVSALKPKNYSDPFGSLKNGVFTPNMTGDQWGTLNNTFSGMEQVTNQLNQPFTLDAYFNNPFRQNTYDMLSNPVMRQYEQDLEAMDDSLNARNQIGGSYDALMKRNLTQNRDYNLNQVNLQSLAASADAYNQMYGNNLNALGALGQSALQQQEYIYRPVNTALGYQSATAPLQQSTAGLYGQQANYYQQKKTGFDNLMDYYKANAQIVGSVAGAAV